MNPNPLRRHVRSLILASLALSAASAPAVAQKALPPLKVIDPSYMDKSVSACVDFFSFANGTWFKHDTIPAAYSSSGVGRDMSDRNELAVRSVLDDAMAKRGSTPAQSTEHKLGTFYATCMDSSAAERDGLSPVKPLLASIDSIKTRPALVAAIAHLQVAGADVGFSYGAQVDVHDATHYIGGFDAGGLGLPDRDYYTKTDKESDSTRTLYVAHIARTLTLGGEDVAKARADAAKILALETEMAKSQLTRVARRDPAATDHVMTMAKFHETAPNVDWATYLRDVAVTVPVNKVNVAEPAFFKRVDALIANTPLDDWKAYLRYHALSAASPYLNKAFVDENFKFNSHFSGAKELLPRWKRCLRTTDGLIGEALGQAYIAKTFSPQARTRARAVIDDIRASFGERVKKLDWMSDATRSRRSTSWPRCTRKSATRTSGATTRPS